MTALELIIYFSISIISLSMVSGKIIVVDINDVKDSRNDLRPVELDYDYNIIENPKDDKFKIPQNGNEDAMVLSMCNRLFRSLHGKQSKVSCVQHIINDDSARDSDPEQYIDRGWDHFSHDYFDIRDLNRAPSDLRFSQDYFDIDDNGRSVNCNGPGYFCDGYRRFKSRKRGKHTSESDDYETQGRTGKRFKVITNGKSKKFKPVINSSDEDGGDTEYASSKNHDKTEDDIEVKKHLYNENSEKFSKETKYKQYDTKYSQGNRYSDENSNTSEESDEEVTKSNHKNYNGDKYYSVLQGNKVYDSNNFRRQRPAYFLPKRVRWEPEDLEKLSYYWINGPKRELSRS